MVIGSLFGALGLPTSLVILETCHHGFLSAATGNGRVPTGISRGFDVEHAFVFTCFRIMGLLVAVVGIAQT